MNQAVVRERRTHQVVACDKAKNDPLYEPAGQQGLPVFFGAFVEEKAEQAAGGHRIEFLCLQKTDRGLRPGKLCFRHDIIPYIGDHHKEIDEVSDLMPKQLYEGGPKQIVLLFHTDGP